MTACDSGGTYRIAVWDTTYSNKTIAMQRILRLVVGKCCNVNTTIKVTRFANHQQDLEEGFDLDTEDFICPIAKRLNASPLPLTNSYYSFLGALESPGIALLIRDETTSTIEFLGMLSSLWELLVIIILCCVIAGVLVWALDTRWNSKDFPRPFLDGVSAGIWWAFVSMTTVGYGDKTPKSIYGRILGCIWILAGTILIAIFTAALTTAFSQDGVIDTGIFGKKVGVLNGTGDYLSMLATGGNVTGTMYENFEAMTEGLERGEVTRLAVDVMYIVYFTKLLEEKNFRYQAQIDRPTIHGIMANKRRISDNELECFQYQMERSRFEYYTKFDTHNSLSKIADTLKGSEALDRMLEVSPVSLAIATSLVLVCFAVIALVDHFALKKKTQAQAVNHNAPTIAVNGKDSSPVSNPV